MSMIELHHLLAASGLALLLGCTAVAVRPHFRPLPGARSDTLAAPPETLIAALSRRLEESGVRAKRRSEAEGYLETEWFDLRSLGVAAPAVLGVGRVVRIRAFADPVPPGSAQLVVETVYRRTLDPSVPDRLEEVLVPPDHPADSLVRELINQLPGKRRASD